MFAYTGTPLEKLSWKCPTLGCHWRNSNFAAYTGTPLEGPWQPSHTQAHIVKQSSIHASLKWQDGGTPISGWTGLCKFNFYLEFTTLQWIPVLLLNMWVLQHHSAHAFDISTIIVFVYLGWQVKRNQFSSNNPHQTSCIRGCMLGSDLTHRPPNQILSVHWDTTGQTTLEDQWYHMVHYSDATMGAIASQINSLTIVFSDADQREHQSSALLAFVQGIHRWPVNSPHKWLVTRKCFHLMTSSWTQVLWGTHLRIVLQMLS